MHHYYSVNIQDTEMASGTHKNMHIMIISMYGDIQQLKYVLTNKLIITYSPIKFRFIIASSVSTTKSLSQK